MKRPASRRRWRKRVWLPVAGALGLVAALAVAVLRSRDSTLVIYNETGGPLPALSVRAGGQAHRFAGLREEESVRLRLANPGAAGPVELELASDPPWEWRGGQLQARAGQRCTIRLYPGGAVELDSQLSFWQRLIGQAPAMPEGDR
jgi:hypothetical protein